LNSIASQSFNNIEHIVIDGGSTDGTLECIKQAKNKINYLVSESDNGIYDALNKGIQKATGDIIGILHSDDIYADPNVISEVNIFFESSPNIDIVMGNVLYFDDIKKGRPTRHYRSDLFKPWMLRFGFAPAHTATFIRTSFANRVGPYCTDLNTAGDFEFFVRVFLMKQKNYAYLKRTLVFMRNGGKSNSGVISYLKSSNEIIFALIKNQIYSNWAFILWRLPLKAIGILFFKLRVKFKTFY
jgi:glycosyltransferase involved in cell wall biosynthesis